MIICPQTCYKWLLLEKNDKRTAASVQPLRTTNLFLLLEREQRVDTDECGNHTEMSFV